MIFIHLYDIYSPQDADVQTSQAVQPQTVIPECIHPTTTTGQLLNAGSMLVHRQLRWYNIVPALVHCHVFVVHTQIAGSPVFV